MGDAGVSPRLNQDVTKEPCDYHGSFYMVKKETHAF